MKTVLFITRKLQRSFGGMQTQTRVLCDAFVGCSDIHVRIVGFSGHAVLLPFFLLRSVFSALFFRGDTVHLGDASLSPLFVFLFFLRPHLRRTVTVHGLDLTWSFPGYSLLLRRSLRYAHCVAAVSQSTAQLLHELGVPKEKIFVLPCALPLPALQETERKFQILLLQRLIPRKGVLWFLSSVAPRLLLRHPDLRIVIAGDGPERAAISSWVQQSAHCDAIDVRGEVSEKMKDDVLWESSLLVVPNIVVPHNPEGFGIVCLEAAARGLPTVAARIEGLQDALEEGVTGMFFESGSDEDALRVTLQALETAWDTERMRAVIRERFFPELIASRYAHEIF